jgi:hypothetical protein
VQQWYFLCPHIKSNVVMVGEFRHLITQNSGSKYLTVLDRNLGFVVTFHIEKQFPKNCSGIVYARMCTHGQLVRGATAGKAPKAWDWPRFWVSIRSYKKQPVKKICGRILGLAWLKFAVAPLLVVREFQLMLNPLDSRKTKLLNF